MFGYLDNQVMCRCVLVEIGMDDNVKLGPVTPAEVTEIIKKARRTFGLVDYEVVDAIAREAIAPEAFEAGTADENDVRCRSQQALAMHKAEAAIDVLLRHYKLVPRHLEEGKGS